MQQVILKPQTGKLKLWCYKLMPYLAIIFVMFFVTQSSPLYQHAYNDIDMSTSLAVAKAIHHGQVYMKDIFEQRGMYFYWLHLPGMALFHDNIYLAKLWVWLCEVTSFSLVYTIFNKIKKQPLINVILVIYLMSCFSYGEAAEPEVFILPIVAYTAYLGININKFNLKQDFILGVLFGIIIEIKYGSIGTIAGFYFAIGMYLLFKKQFKNFFKTAGIAVLGVLTAQVPLLINLIMQNNVVTYLHNYFLSNSSGLKDIANIRVNFLAHLAALTFFVAVVIWPLCKTLLKQKFLSKFVFFTQLLFGIGFALLISHYIDTYDLPLDLLLLAYSTVSFKEAFKFKNAPKFFKYLISGLAIVVFGATLFGRFRSVQNHLEGDRTTAPIVTASKLIARDKPNRTLLTLGDLSSNLYDYNSNYPNIFYFEQVSIPYSTYKKQYLDQIKYLKQKRPDWVMTNASLNDNQHPDKDIFNHLYTYRPDLYPKRYVQKAFKSDGKIYYRALRVPKVLLKNYVCVFDKIDYTRPSLYGYYSMQLWTRPSTAKRMHLKVYNEPHVDFKDII